ncbi:MAG: IS110 family transposase [Gammaproteobacteria bacterium]
MEKILYSVDIAKNVFQLHYIDEDTNTKSFKLSRGRFSEFFVGRTPGIVAMEACATAHYWGRQMMNMGHEVRLLPPTAVKPFVKRGKKNDAADAAAIDEAAQRPGIHTVPVKTEAQQAVLALHTQREALIGERTRSANGVRALFAEFGIITRQGIANVGKLCTELESLPNHAAVAAQSLFRRIDSIDEEIKTIETELLAFHKANETSCNLATIPTVGPLLATLVVATVGDPARFKRGRNFAAWLGIVSKQNSSGGKQRLGRITKAGNPEIRRLLFLGALSTVHRAKPGTWLGELKARKPYKVTAIALANKTARMIWAVLSRGDAWRPTAPRAA